MFQQYHLANQQQQQSSNNNSSKQRIDPDKIYPKRLGTYQNGNALVLQYYNLSLDKFKKHIIPLDRGKSIKQNIDEIYSNTKHFILLKKVQPKYIQGVIKGQSFLNQLSSAVNINYNYHSRSQQQQQHSYIDNNIININSYSYGYSSQRSEQSLPYSTTQQQQQYPSNTSSSQYNYNNQSVSEIITNNNNFISQIIQNDWTGSGITINKQTKEKIQQVEDYYDEEFEEFQISQSMGKKSGVKNIMTNNNINHVKEKIVSQTSHNTKQKVIEQQPQEKQQKKQKKSKKSKQGKKKSKKKKQPQPQQDQFEFDFLDDDGSAPKSSTNKKKQSSKQKEKEKPKKQKQKPSVKEDKKPKFQPPKIQQPIQQTIQEDFDFDL